MTRRTSLFFDQIVESTRINFGLGLVFSGDMSSRVIISRINDPNIEEPEKRSFKIKDLRAFVLENRIRLVHAALTVLRGFYVAGRPRSLSE